MIMLKLFLSFLRLKQVANVDITMMLRKCIQVHDSLLTELFRVTVALSESQNHNSNDTDFHNNGEASFLEENKLSE